MRFMILTASRVAMMLLMILVTHGNALSHLPFVIYYIYIFKVLCLLNKYQLDNTSPSVLSRTSKLLQFQAKSAILKALYFH